MRKIELLAPAKNLEYGIEAINCGADAVYIGGPKFGARVAASNSVSDIAALCKYGHKFGAKVFVAINTIIFDEEIPEVEKITWELYSAGVDALIVQDMAFAKMDIAPIPLHASTQTTNLTPQRAQFLEEVGFERVILERALSLEEIESICNSTTAEIEAFVHGAICVSYSGNCFLSQYVAGRSANRGACAQPCRSTYDLLDEKGDVILRDKHLLSLKDLSLENSLKKMVKMGVSSFKIEGRLKDITYLKNITTHYNNLLNKTIEEVGESFSRASNGKVLSNFCPNPQKTFSRDLTPYLINGQKKGLASFNSAKSLGEYLGKIEWCRGNKFSISNCCAQLANGDGLCFITPSGRFSGANINRVESETLLAAKPLNLEKGTDVYRNLDKQFLATLDRSQSLRKLDCSIVITNSDEGASILACSGEFEVLTSLEQPFEEAQNIERGVSSIKSQFSKSGSTIFDVTDVEIVGRVPFIAASVANGLRREILEALEAKIDSSYPRLEGVGLVAAPLNISNIDYKANVANHLARQFYSECGATEIDECVELSDDFRGVELMRMSYCIRKEIGECLKEGGKYKKLYLKNGNRKFLIKFDCAKCQSALLLERDL